MAQSPLLLDDGEMKPVLARMGGIIADLRAEAGLSVIELATALGIRPAHLIQIEMGVQQPSAELLTQVYAFFGRMK